MLIKKGGNRRTGNPNQLPGLGGGGGGGGSGRYQPPPPPPGRGYGGYQQPPPLGPRTASLPPTAPQPRADPGQASRLDALEQRLLAMENNSRSMLNQFTQIQQETVVGLRRDTHSLAEQREGRNRLEMAMRGAQGKVAEMDQRMARTSAALRETESSLQALGVQTKNVQNLLMAKGKGTGEMTMERLQELRKEIVDLLQYHDASRNVTGLLKEDLHNMRMKVESVHGDLTAMSQSTRLQDELYQEETRRTVRGGVGRATSTVALEGRVMRLQQNLMDVDSRMSHEAKKHEMTQMQQNQKINDLRTSLGESLRYGDDDLRDLQRRTGGLTGTADSEKQRLQRAIDDVRRQLDSKLRGRSGGDLDGNKVLERLKSLEVALQQEVTGRTSHESALKSEVEKKLAEITSYSDHGFQSVRKMTEAEHDQTRTRFKELSDALNLLDSSRDQDQRETEQMLEKQKEERRKLARVLDDEVDDIADRLRIGMTSLQAAQAQMEPGTGRPPALSIDEIERLQNMNTEGAREQLAKSLAETELKLSELSTRVKQQDEAIQNKLRMAERSDDAGFYVMGDQMSQKMDSVTFSQERLKRQINMLEDDVKESPADASDLKQQLESQDRRLTEQLEQETEERRRQMDELRRDRGDADAANLSRLQQDIDEAQVSVTKLGDAMQVVNRTIGGKIKEGKREREQVVTDLKRNIDRLNSQTRDIKDRIKHPKDYGEL